MTADRIFACRGCGRDVAWRTAKSGKRYLAQPQGWSGSETFAERTYWPSHYCTPDPERVAAREAAEAATLASAIEEGRIIKGVEVVVVKGRKAPKGTTGVVFWVADEGDAYDVLKVGFKTADGVKHFVDIKNLEVVR